MTGLELAELRGWIEENRAKLKDEDVESEADFLVRMMVKARMKGLRNTAERQVLFMVELMCRKCMTMAGDGSSQKDRDFADTKLANGIRLAKMLGVGAEKIAVATMKATRG